MHRPRFLTAKSALLALVGVSLVAFGVAVGVASRGSSPVSFNATAANAPSRTPHLRNHGGGGFELAGGLLGVVVKDTGLSRQQVVGEIAAGKTLDEIAGSKAAQVKSDALATLKTRLDTAVSHGVLTSTQEDHLLADARDALDQLMAAKLGAAGGRGSLGGGFGFGGPFHHRGGFAGPSPSPSPTTGA